MSSTTQRAPGPNHRAVELGVAAVTIAFALLVIGGSYRVGIKWDADGPGAGFFPFYVGVLILCAGIFNFVQAWTAADGAIFAEWGQLRQVSLVVVPTAIYVAVLPFTGIYLASALLIAFFMRWLGRYGWALVAAVAVGVPVITFLIFEKWFLVPLPKGPIESLFGY